MNSVIEILNEYFLHILSNDDLTCFGSFNQSFEYIEPKFDVDVFYRSRTGYNYSFLFSFEKKFFNEQYVLALHKRMNKYFFKAAFIAVAYLIVIFLSQQMMKQKGKFQIRSALIAWNFLLASFSILGAIRVWPEFVHVIKTKGVEHSYCSRDWQFGVSLCWTTLFILSKVPELIDTCFIVARKQKLIFLHWYHHFSVRYLFN